MPLRKSFWPALLWGLSGTIAISINAHAEPIEGKRSPSEIVDAATPSAWRDVSPGALAVFEIEGRGDVFVELTDRFAPKTAAQFKHLVSAGFYDGLSFYRVIENFVAQGGDPFGDETLPEGAMPTLPPEFETGVQSDLGNPIISLKDDYADKTSFYKGFAYGIESQSEKAWLLSCTGTLAFGREVGRDTASSEFYFTLQPQRYLDRNMSLFGRVLEGSEHLQALSRQLPPEDKEDPVGDQITRVWLGNAPPSDRQTPEFQVLKTDTALFRDYVEARANRPEAFFYVRPNHVNACALQIPVRRKPVDSTGQAQ
ncbi:MAG: peptidylprolyl isomerase [Pseudomonadota bacterium]